MLVRIALFSTAILAILCGWLQLVRFFTTAGKQSPAPALLGRHPTPSTSQIAVFRRPIFRLPRFG